MDLTGARVTLPLLLLSLGIMSQIQAADPDLLTDFFIPEGLNASEVDGEFFTFSGLRDSLTADLADGKGFDLGVAFSSHFQALTGLGVSFATLNLQPRGVVPLHIHSRASEIIFVIAGQLEVGFVDSTNKFYSSLLSAGDIFVFPEALVHYYANLSNSTAVHAVATFGSSEPGYTLLPANLFGSGISEAVLQKSFRASPLTISSLKAPFEIVRIV
ncbi:hypothetical protein Mapa_009058 [Marchantia paleacea]|nr:hypothetical protein Mapa_009058 [Marchantia paleacea]